MITFIVHNKMCYPRTISVRASGSSAASGSHHLYVHHSEKCLCLIEGFVSHEQASACLQLLDRMHPTLIRPSERRLKTVWALWDAIDWTSVCSCVVDQPRTALLSVLLQGEDPSRDQLPVHHR